MKFREFLSLVWLNLTVTTRSVGEFFKVAFKYYSNFKFVKCDLSLYMMYLFHNPYRISKRFLKKKGEEDIYAYGETPLTTLDKICRECRVRKEDCVFELGSGRGRTCFWLNSFIGCRVVGIEHIPEFVERANRIKRKLGLRDIEFRCEEMQNSELAGATVIYLYGTCLEEKIIDTLIEKFKTLAKGVKIITVSYPLSDYSSSFQTMKRFQGTFPWGVADVYLQVLKS